MLDSIWLPPTVHIWSGMLVLTATLAAVVYTAVRAWRRRDLGPAGNAILIFAQLTLMAQAVLGIKLLDQGLGPLQLFIHYLGGLGPLLFFLVYYWLPSPVRTRRWLSFGVAASAFLFAVMAFGIGMSYVAGQVA
ncbi:MAG: hypothetical protein KF875_04105 [Trueperaceae bacterium]|nr:hypothetical protein [Trueperaceae bacterium]MCO5174283.1 hypothetical protein [Trueperaceae bacterium]MCW5819775.1 hypothetical protein [Trueperaceae bacterium]